MASARGAQHSDAGKTATTSCTCSEEDADGDRCSYEAERDKRVAKMKQLMEPLVKASKNW